MGRVKEARRRSEVISVREVQGKGRGVFADRRLVRGEIIERAPVIVLPGGQWRLLTGTALKDYPFF